ncbi:secreted RxLR effector protein 161-like [Lycium barbarum]|uniref:secreted RxLR effector protein 161-like n=1 Tax=Lycium barbarum TaxID=112863 RepID=UPI00293EF565|nr:secreted RxLR effector protein 161-like [Lycium barbarum]
MSPGVHLMKDDGDPFDDPKRYRRLVGKLNYLIVTRPDIAFAVSVVSQFMSAPTVKHWEALEQILCYLKRAPRLAILYSNHGYTRVECFADADYAGSKIDGRSTTGYCVFVGGNLISWRSKKQGVVSRSSAESEYRAMSQSTCEIMWIHHLITEIGLKHYTPAKLWCDNQAAFHIASNPVYHERTKHIEVDCHFIREIQENQISTGYVKMGEKLADVFTKALNGTRVDYLCNKLGMINIYAPA